MNVTKYEHSCMVVSKGGARLVIDQHRVGIGAARIDTQYDRHLCSSESTKLRGMCKTMPLGYWRA